MNLAEQNELFKTKYLKNTDNIFEAINQWCKDASKLNSQYQGRLSNSESLTGVLINKVPENINRRKFVKDAESQYVIRYIEEELTQIDDIDVRISVNQSLNESIKEKNLVFKYLKILTEAQKARVRIICKMIWYNLYPKKG